jgi:hypothetical protein
VAGGPDAQRLVLEFPTRPEGGERLASVAHYGGRYLMFLCSECSRSERVLYARRLTRDIKDLRYAFSNVELKEVAENLKYVTDAVREADGRYRLYGVGSVLDILAPEGADPQIFIE